VINHMALSKEQKVVYDWLNSTLQFPVFAEAYKGSIELLSLKQAGYISFVSHTGRDLMTRLASTVSGIKSGRVQYQQHLDKLQNDWKDEWRIDDGLSPVSTAQGHFIPIKVCKKISDLIEDHQAGRIRSQDADGLFFSTFLDYSDKEKVPKNFLSEWKSAKEWFLGHAHLRKKPFRTEIASELEKHFKCLDGYLYIAASSQYDRLKELNGILDTTNQ